MKRKQMNWGKAISLSALSPNCYLEFVSVQYTFAWQGAMCAHQPPEAERGRVNLIADCISDSGHEHACRHTEG